MKRWWLAMAVALVGLPLAAAAPARAMTVLQVDLKALVSTADVVLYGKVAGTRVLDRRKQGRGVWTEIELQVAEVWKGDARLAGKRFSWMHVGGTTSDGITVAVPGLPQFSAGEETVVILERTSESHVVSGGPQGKFTVRTSPAGQKTVTRDMADVHYIRRDPATGEMRPAPKQVEILRSLNEFRAEVAGYVAAAAKAAPLPPAKAGPVGK